MTAAQDELELSAEAAGRIRAGFISRALRWFFAFFLFLAVVPSAYAWTEIGINFRDSGGFVTDGANETYCTDADTFPTTRGGADFGWGSALSDGGRDRDSGVDRRFAGMNYTANTSQATFTLTLPSAGSYTVCVALGDEGGDHVNQYYWRLLDNATVLTTVSDADGTEFGKYDDATGVERTTANWVANNVCVTHTFATTSLKFLLGDGSSGGITPIAHMKVTQNASATVTEYDFDTLGNCSTGQEVSCQTDNGLASGDLQPGTTDGLRIKSASSFGITPPVGSGSSGIVCGSGPGSGTGPGYIDVDIPGGGTTSACVGEYVYFGRGYLANVSSTGNHGSALKYTDGASCSGYISVDWALENPRIIMEANATASCGTNAPSSFNLAMDESTWTAKNNQWYWVEICSTLNTTASGSDGDDGNGIVRMYVDEVLVLEYTNVNMQGNAGPAEFDSVFGPRSYVGLGVPRHEPMICFDHMKITAGGITPAGPEPGDTLGSGDGPYWLAVAGDGMEQRKLELDCSQTGTGSRYVSSAWSEDWKSGKTFVNSPDNNDYACNVTDCASCTTSTSLAASTSAANAGAGVYFTPGSLGGITSTLADGIYIHGHIYLDNLPVVSMALPGLAKCTSFNCSTGGSTVTNWLALTVTNGKWGLLPKTAGTVGTAHESTTAAAADTWTEFEIAVTDANKCSLAINGYWTIDAVDCNQDIASWAFANTEYRFVVAGTIDSRTESGAFVTNIDDFDAGGASFWSSRGWNSASVPNGFGPGTTAPGSGGSDDNSCRFQLLRRRR